MHKEDNRLFVYVPNEIKRKAKAKAALENIPMSALITEWLRLWVEEKISTPQVRKEKRET
jgi:hypothetical protein